MVNTIKSASTSMMTKDALTAGVPRKRVVEEMVAEKMTLEAMVEEEGEEEEEEEEEEDVDVMVREWMTEELTAQEEVMAG